MSRRTLVSHWRTLETMTVPDDACVEQRADMELAFYWGAIAALSLVKRRDELESSSVYREIAEFAKRHADRLQLVTDEPVVH